MLKRRTRFIAGITAAGAIGLVMAGCSAPRSVEAFCSTMEKHKTSYLSSWEAASNAGGLEGLLTGAGAIGDLKIMWKDLAAVAPEGIRGDVEAVSEAWQKQEDNATSGNLLGSLATGLLNAGALTRIDTYTRENCA